MQRYLIVFIACTLVVLPDARPLRAQHDLRNYAEGVELVRLGDARSLASDPMGNLWVADAGRDVVLKLDADGQVLYTLGGSGMSAGRFDEPMDVDPTNGLLILVADRGNSRIQRFSRALAYLGALPVPAGSNDRFDAAFPATIQRRDEALAVPSDGAPVSIVAMNTNEILCVEANSGTLLHWNAESDFRGKFTGSDFRDGVPAEPVAVTIDPTGRVLVADEGTASVLVFDEFGVYRESWMEGLLEGIQKVRAFQSSTWIVLTDRVEVLDRQGNALFTLRFDLKEPLIDAHRTETHVYILTRSRLLRYAVSQSREEQG